MAGKGTLTIRILGDAGNLSSSLRDSEARVERFGRNLEKTGRRLTAGVTAPIAAVGAAALKAASDQEQAFGAIESVLGDAAGTVKAFGETAAEGYGLSQEQVARLGAVTAAQLQSFGYSNTEAASTVVELQKRAADMAATFGGPVDEAVGAISALLRGERDPIERYGVAIKQSDVNARLAADGLSELEGEARKTAEAQAGLTLLMEQTSGAAGAFGRELDTAAGAAAVAKATIQNALADLGESILPIAADLAKGVSDVASAFSALPESVQGSVVKIAALAALAGPVSVLGGNAVKLAVAIKGLGAAAGPVGVVLYGLSVIVGGLIKRHIEEEQAVSSLKDAYLESTEAVEAQRRALVELSLEEQGAFESARQLGIGLDTVVEAALGNADALEVVNATMSAASAAAGELAWAVEGGSGAFDETDEAVRTLEGSLALAGRQVVEFTEKGRAEAEQVADLEGRYLDAAHAMSKGLDPALANLVVARQEAADAADLHVDALDDEAGAAATAEQALENLQATMRAAVDPVFGAIAAERSYQEALVARAEAVADNETSAQDLLEADLKVAEAFASRQGSLLELEESMQDGTTSTEILAGALNGLGDDAPGALRAVLDAAEQSLGQAAGVTERIGLELGLGLAAGITMSRRAVMDSLTNVINDAAEAAKLAARIKSPSRLFAEDIGEPITEGIAEGILEAMASPLSAVERLMGEIRDRAQDQVSTVFSGIRSSFGVRDAEEGLAEARAGGDRLEIEEAQLRLVEAKMRQIQAGQELAAQGPEGGQRFVDAAIAAGIPQWEAKRLLEGYAGGAYMAAKNAPSSLSGKTAAGGITINMPAGSDGDDVVRALKKWTDQNGPLPVAVA